MVMACKDNLIATPRLKGFEKNALVIYMTRGKHEIADTLYKTFSRFDKVVIDLDGEEHVFEADSFIRLLEDYENGDA